MIVQIALLSYSPTTSLTIYLLEPADMDLLLSIVLFLLGPMIMFVNLLLTSITFSLEHHKSLICVHCKGPIIKIGRRFSCLEDFWVLQIRRVLRFFLAFQKLKCTVLYMEKDENI